MFFMMVSTQKPFSNYNMDHVILDSPFLGAHTPTLSSAGQQVRRPGASSRAGRQDPAGELPCKGCTVRQPAPARCPASVASPAYRRQAETVPNHTARAAGPRRGQRNACAYRARQHPSHCRIRGGHGAGTSRAELTGGPRVGTGAPRPRPAVTCSRAAASRRPRSAGTAAPPPALLPPARPAPAAPGERSPEPPVASAAPARGKEGSGISVPGGGEGAEPPGLLTHRRAGRRHDSPCGPRRCRGDAAAGSAREPPGAPRTRAGLHPLPAPRPITAAAPRLFPPLPRGMGGTGAPWECVGRARARLAHRRRKWAGQGE